MRALVLDFDGVISDSAVECFAVAQRTLDRMRSATDGNGPLDPPEPPSAEAVKASARYRAFLDIMPLGNRAEDFAVALLAIEAARPLPDQGAYDAFKASQSAALLDRFHGCFYEERARLRTADTAAWRALMTPFSSFVELLARRSADRVLAIATAKDRPSVEILLDHYGLSRHISRECVIDKEAGRDKRAHLRLLQERLDLPFEAMTFVDDKLNHLESVSSLGVCCVLAGWGYNGPREQTGARARGFAVSQLETAEAILFEGAS